MLTFASISNRIGPMRPDKLPREWQLAFQVAAKRLAEETFGLQEVAEFTIPSGTVYVPVYDPTTDLKEAVHIFKAEWQDPAGNWNPLRPLNERQMEATTRHAFNSPGEMRAFTYVQGKFYPNRPPAVDTQVRGTIAYVPVGEFSEVDFGAEYRDALVEGALAYLLRLPGKEQDRAAAAASEAAFQSMASGLRGVNLTGAIGFARASRMVHRHREGFFNRDVLRY